MTQLTAGKCSIEFLGARENVPSLREAAAIFVLSSHYERLPLSVIEAMSKGLSIVASDVGGFRELVSHGVNGYLFAAGDHVGLAAHLDTLIRDINLRHRMAAESIRRYQSEFTSERMMAQLVDVYRQVIGGSESYRKSERTN